MLNIAGVLQFFVGVSPAAIVLYPSRRLMAGVHPGSVIQPWQRIKAGLQSRFRSDDQSSIDLRLRLMASTIGSGISARAA